MRRWWGGHFLFAESALAVLAGVVFSLWQTDFGGATTLDALLKSNQAAFYGALATIWGALLGFAIASTSIVLSYGESDRMHPVTQHPRYTQLGSVLRAVNPILALATLAALVALLLDKDSGANPVARDFAFTTSLLAIVSVGRTIWILDNIIRITTGPSRARGGDEP